MSAGAPPPATLDHLVVAATTLADGIEYIAEITGVAPQPGGKHVAMGTHNALAAPVASGPTSRSSRSIPTGPKPARPRWFDLDDIALQAELAERPRLIHWVARTTDIARRAARVPGRARRRAPDGARGLSLANHDSRRRRAPGKGIVPTLIEWDVPQHPAESLPKSNVSIAGLAAAHPDPAAIRAALAALGLDGALPVTYDRDARLAAMLRTPRGIVTL